MTSVAYRDILCGAVEAGGTKFVCALGTATGQLVARRTIPTTEPEETIERVVRFFQDFVPDAAPTIGIGSFGPLDLRKSSATYGMITSTPKSAWRNCDLARTIASATHAANVIVDTDVNCAALAEYRFGAGQGHDPLVYVTLGTGIGAGIIVNGSLVHGLVHPEMGHIRIPHDSATDPFAGCCPAHGDCLEGLASGVAIAQRWGTAAHLLRRDHAAWKLETRYIACALANLIFTLSPKRIIIGGGLRHKLLWDLLHAEVAQLLNGYLQAAELTQTIDTYIVPAALGDDAGVLGALLLAHQGERDARPGV
jgi:fructokinase